ncbi:MAG: 30S ribosomal protein S20 [Chitinophagales bacterium]|nr:30S ribosomal protein S20 [Chitinophagales bacterium]
MANHKSAEKRARQAAKRRLFNRYYAKTTRNAIRDIRGEKNETEAKKALPKVLSLLDKLAKRGYIHKNKAGNLKSGLMKRVLAKAK